MRRSCPAAWKRWTRPPPRRRSRKVYVPGERSSLYIGAIVAVLAGIVILLSVLILLTLWGLLSRQSEKQPEDIDVCCGSCMVDGKSILGILSLGIHKKLNVVIHD